MFNTTHHLFECIGKIENNIVKYKIRIREKYNFLLIGYTIISVINIIDSLVNFDFSGILILAIISLIYYLVFRIGYQKFKDTVEYEFQYCNTGKYVINYEKSDSV